MAASKLTSHALPQRTSWRTGAWVAFEAIAGLLSVVLLALVMRLVWLVLVGMPAIAAPNASQGKIAPPVVDSASAAAAAAPTPALTETPGAVVVAKDALAPADRRGGDGGGSGIDPKDAVNNTMTAVALAVSVVTLLMTLGTTWFADTGRKLHERMDEANRMMQTLRESLDATSDIESIRGRVDSLNVPAWQGVSAWVVYMGTSPSSMVAWHSELWLNLQQLRTDNLEVRTEAFVYLAQHLEPWTDHLRPVRAYTEECDRYIRAMRAYRGETLTPAAVADADRDGLACRVFDPTEVERVKARRQREQSAKL